MNKPSRKLRLHRQTLYQLDVLDLARAQGGGTLIPDPVDTLARPSRPCPIPT
jgi:hypothetical protein